MDASTSSTRPLAKVSTLAAEGKISTREISPASNIGIPSLFAGRKFQALLERYVITVYVGEDSYFFHTDHIFLLQIIILCSLRLPDKWEFVSLYIRYFVGLGMNFDGFAINNKYAPHINLTTASAMQIIETGILGNI